MNEAVCRPLGDERRVKRMIAGERGHRLARFWLKRGEQRSSQSVEAPSVEMRGDKLGLMSRNI